MFQIDLLKGQGRPYRPSPATAAVLAVVFVVPIIAALMAVAGVYAKRLQLAALEKQNQHYQQSLAHIQPDIEYLYQLRQKIDAAKVVCAEIGLALTFRQTVSDFLAELANSLPPQIALKDLDIKRSGRLERKNGEDGSAKSDISVRRTIELTLQGPDSVQTDADVQAFLEQFSSLPAVASRIADVRIVSRQQLADDSRQTLYKVEFMCKEQRMLR